ncbi:MAG: hypothetical protein CL917_12115 [Deltaproteobacteria bacterium]|nr:hypothetical protein [Deltaproteobacteria bacterium]
MDMTSMNRMRFIQAWMYLGFMGFVLGLASGAMASEVVDLRIGAHEDFTRIVFELDRPTGYRIERASPKPGISDLVVTLDATSIPRKLQSKSDLIGSVKVTPRGDGSLAEIRLAREGLRLKEMILSSPPRIVLDILSSKKGAKSNSSPSNQAPRTKPAQNKKPVVKPAPSPKPLKVISVAAPKPKPPAVVVRTKPSRAPSVGVELSEPRRVKKAATQGLRAEEPQEPMGRELAVLELEADQEIRIAPIEPSPEEVLEKFKAPVEEEDSGNGALWTTVLGIVALTLILVALRRRRASMGSDDLDEGVEVGGPPAFGDNPFANLPKARPRADSLEAEPAHVPHEKVAEIELDLEEIEDDPEKEAALVESPFVASDFAPVSDLETHVNILDEGPAVGLTEETQKLLGDFERRTESLERRLEEASEARERLERQVAAQTEELRVQRAAIARTQRAVRNMNRPDDEGPTEPTPRNS